MAGVEISKDSSGKIAASLSARSGTNAINYPSQSGGIYAIIADMNELSEIDSSRISL